MAFTALIIHNQKIFWVKLVKLEFQLVQFWAAGAFLIVSSLAQQVRSLEPDNELCVGRLLLRRRTHFWLGWSGAVKSGGATRDGCETRTCRIINTDEGGELCHRTIFQRLHKQQRSRRVPAVPLYLLRRRAAIKKIIFTKQAPNLQRTAIGRFTAATNSS